MIGGAVRRVWRNLLFLWAGNERYYPASRWEGIYRAGYHLDGSEQDARYGALLGLMERYDRSLPILDMGCGEGILEQKFRRLSKSAMLGIDYSQEAIRLAIAKGIPDCEFICADYRKRQFREQFGIIVLNESLYYVDNPVEALDHLSQYLLSNGVLIVSMFESFPNRCIWRRLQRRFTFVRVIIVEDKVFGKAWRIRVLEPRRSSARKEALKPIGHTERDLTGIN